MSWQAGIFLFIIWLREKERRAEKTKKGKSLKSELERLLLTPASDEEKERLTELSIKLKSPTRMTVLAAALYKKATAGDLSSLKEIVNMLGDRVGGNERVILLDDIPKET